MLKEVKNKIIISISLIIAFILIMIGVSYAIFRFVGTGSKVNQITTASISMDYKESDSIINLNNALPTTDATGKVRLQEGEYFDFSITTKVSGNAIINWEIAAEDFEDNTFDGANVKYYLTKLVGDEELPVSNNLPKVYTEESTMNKYTGRPANMMSLLVGSTTTKGTETTNYRLRLYVDESYNPQGDGGGLIYKTKINVYGSDTIWHQITADSDVTVETDAKAGDTVSFEVEEKEGYSYNGAEILNSRGEVIATITKDKKEFTMPEESISIKILWKAKESTLKKEFIYSSGNGVSSSSVTSIVTKNNTSVPTTAVKSWDVSEEGNGGIIAYVEGTEGNYKLTIGGDGKITAPADCSRLFHNSDTLVSIDISHFDTSKVINMSNMFGGCDELSSVNLNGLDTSNVTDMQMMFAECPKLASINFGSGFNTAKVENMWMMFGYCPSLTSLDLRSFDTSKATKMRSMFVSDSNLTSIKVSNKWTTANADAESMFNGCGTDHVTIV